MYAYACIVAAAGGEDPAAQAGLHGGDLIIYKDNIIHDNIIHDNEIN